MLKGILQRHTPLEACIKGARGHSQQASRVAGCSVYRQRLMSMESSRQAAASVNGAALQGVSRQLATHASQNGASRYEDASREELLTRIQELEARNGTSCGGQNGTSGQDIVAHRSPLFTAQNGRAESKDFAAQPGPSRRKKQPASPRPFDIAWYPCRKIALRFSYDGANYSGLEIQSRAAAEASNKQGGGPVRTVEGELWKALCEARFVDDAVGMHGVGWSRCGRTDRGVSAAGQVVALWVRSKRVDEWPQRRALERLNAELRAEKGFDLDEESDGEREGAEAEASSDEGMVPSRHERVREAMANLQPSPEDDVPTKIPAQPDAEEYSYVMALNRLLPSDIRVQAWSPVQAGFSSRFDCRYRHYKYFFTEGAPWVRRRGDDMQLAIAPRLDIHAMRNAAQRLLGEHDFRNLCKIDGSKQITNFRRRIDGVSIDPVERAWTRRSSERKGTEPVAIVPGSDADDERMYVLNLRGTAFLYHQVRHIMAVLLLVGAGLEKPTIVDELLNVESGQTYKDRLLAARLQGLVLDEDGKKFATELPGSSATQVDGLSSLDVARAAQAQRRRDATDTASTSVSTYLSERQLVTLEHLRDVHVFDRCPAYEMANDRPLMLWECGFRRSDVQWRSGSYDGPIASFATGPDQQVHIPASANINATSFLTRREMHAMWTEHMIAAEMQRHMLLALPSDGNDEALGFGSGAGYLPASTRFAEACFPALESCVVQPSSTSGAIDDDDDDDNPKVTAALHAQKARLAGAGSTVIPLGYGRVKSQPSYRGLHKATRHDTPDEKNARYRIGKGAARDNRKKMEKEKRGGVTGTHADIIDTQEVF